MESSSRKLDLNARRIYLASAMSDCIEDCDIRGLEVVLQTEEADPNVLLPDVNYTPFHAVASSESEDFAENAARLFLKKKGDPNVRSDEFLTPVHVAASWGHARVLKVLLEGGGCPSQEDSPGSDDSVVFLKEVRGSASSTNISVPHSTSGV